MLRPSITDVAIILGIDHPGGGGGGTSWPVLPPGRGDPAPRTVQARAERGRQVGAPRGAGGQVGRWGRRGWQRRRGGGAGGGGGAGRGGSLPGWPGPGGPGSGPGAAPHLLPDLNKSLLRPGPQSPVCPRAAAGGRSQKLAGSKCPGGLWPLEGSRAPGTPSPRLGHPDRAAEPELFPGQRGFPLFLVEPSGTLWNLPVWPSPGLTAPRKRHPSDYSPPLAGEEPSFRQGRRGCS